MMAESPLDYLNSGVLQYVHLCLVIFDHIITCLGLSLKHHTQFTDMMDSLICSLQISAGGANIS